MQNIKASSCFYFGAVNFVKEFQWESYKNIWFWWKRLEKRWFYLRWLELVNWRWINRAWKGQRQGWRYVIPWRNCKIDVLWIKRSTRRQISFCIDENVHWWMFSLLRLEQIVKNHWVKNIRISCPRINSFIPFLSNVLISAAILFMEIVIIYLLNKIKFIIYIQK